MYLWCGNKKVDKIMNFLFSNIYNIENKIVKYDYIGNYKNKINKVSKQMDETNIDISTIKMNNNTSINIQNNLLLENDASTMLNVDTLIPKLAESQNQESINLDDIFKTIDDNYIKFKNYKIGVITDKNYNLWFNGKDIGKVLQYSNTRDAISNFVDIDDKKSLKNIDCNVNNKKYLQSIFINEIGLYGLIFGSKNKENKLFRNWINKIVLPYIKKLNNISEYSKNNEEIISLIKNCL